MKTAEVPNPEVNATPDPVNRTLPPPQNPTNEELDGIRRARKILDDIHAKHAPIARKILPADATGDEVAQKGRSLTLINEPHFRNAREALHFLDKHVSGWPVEPKA